MSLSYLHGVETIESEIGGQAVVIVKSGVIGLIGLAPVGPVNALTLCYNATDDAQFGKAVPGFNIPKTLQIIRSIAGNCPVMVVNVFDITANVLQNTLESQTVTAGRLKLSSSPIGAVTIYESNGTTLASIVKGTDYTLDAFGNFQVISTVIADTTIYKFSYKSLDESTVTNSQLIGGVDGDNNRTGMSLYDLAFNTFGFRAKIFIAPTYSSISAIAVALGGLAAKFKAVYELDAPYGTTPSVAIAGRGINGSIATFQTADQRAELLYPYLKTFDDYSNADEDYPYSAFKAALMVLVDNTSGYWYSSSNQQIKAATGSERPIEWSFDSDSEANQLNAAGITTIAAGFGTGILAWGNRNASFPISADVKNFINIRRTDDIVTESMALAAIPSLDKPIDQAFIDNLRETGNNLMRTLIQRGAVLPGSRVVYNKADNSPSELAAGHIVFERIYMVPTPAERITYNDILDITLLSQLK